MKDKEFILKAIDYVNDVPARVDDFLKKLEEESKLVYKDPFQIAAERYAKYYAGCDPYKETDYKQAHKDFSSKDRWFVVTDQRGSTFLRTAMNTNVFYGRSFSMRLATSQEIENHLISELPKHGIVYYRKIKSPINGKEYTVIPGHGPIYNIGPDQLLLDTDNGYMTTVYLQGKWAEPIYETEGIIEHLAKEGKKAADTPKKKPLPRTKEGITDLLDAWGCSDMKDFKTFLDQYED